MIFTLGTSRQIYTSEAAEGLKKLGFTFKNVEFFNGTLLIDGHPSIDIGSIEELIELSKQLRCPLIIDYRDDYLEICNN